MTKLSKIETKAPDNINKEDIKKVTIELQETMFHLQNLFYASSQNAMLIVLQGIDAAGKDSTIRKVFSGINPMGIQVTSFKKPTEQELAHDFLWRIYPHLPRKGMIQIFNRSHYEDVLVPYVTDSLSEDYLTSRIQLINIWEEHLQASGTLILKFYLHISHEEQQHRIRDRMEDTEKNWKYQQDDHKATDLWEKNIEAYQWVIDKCAATTPWHIIPADQKWYRNYLIAKTVVSQINALSLKYPTL